MAIADRPADIGHQFTADEIKEKYGLAMVEAEVIRTVVEGISQQTMQILMRGGFSPAIRGVGDCSTTIHMVTANGIEMVTTGAFAGPLHPFTAQYSVPLMIDEWGMENLNPGDVVFCNDPYRGAIHQADVYMIRPIFWEGKIHFFSVVVAHLTDLGGPRPGAFWPEARDLYGEGERIPPMLCYSRDVPVRSFFNLFLENTRTAMYNLGDLRCLYGTTVAGERLVHQAITKYGLDKVIAGCNYALDYAERCVRAAIAKLPDGEWIAEDVIDDDGVEDKPIRLVLTLRKRGDSVELDGSGTERQSLGYLKSGMVDVPRSLIGAKRFLDPDTPINGGFFRAIDITVPPGSQLLPLPPAACSNHMETGCRVIGMGLELFGKAAPEQAVASDARTLMLPAFGGRDTRPGHEGRDWAIFTSPGGGWGGYDGGDGLNGAPNAMGNGLKLVWEQLEVDIPVIIWGNDYLIDSAGAGKFRGGVGNTITVEHYLPGTVITITGGRANSSTPGINGGGASGACYVLSIRPDEKGRWAQHSGVVPGDYVAASLVGRFDEQGRPDPNNGSTANSKSRMANYADVADKPGVVQIAIGGGSGWGNPLERDVELVRKDVWNELVSVEGAAEFYGVVVDPKAVQVDNEGTEEKRRELREKQQRGEWKVPVAHSPLWLK